MMKRLFASTALVLALGAHAFAADLPVRAAPPAPVFVAPPIFTWTGFYAGVHIGAHWRDRDVHRGNFTNLTNANFNHPTLTNAGNTLDNIANSLGFAVAPGTLNGYSIPAGELGRVFPARIGTGDEAGFMGGLQAGYNQQFGMFVVGVEGDISYLGGGDDGGRVVRNVALGAGQFGPATLDTDLRVRHKMNWLGTLRLRAGVAWDRVMVYGTGGFAFGNPHHSVAFTARLRAPNVNYDQSITFRGENDEWQGGWTAGAGVEFAVTDNMTIKGEWLYYDLGSTTVTARSAAAPGLAGSYRFKNDGHIARVGLNWKW